MKFNKNDGASALEGSTTPPLIRMGVPNSMILPVLLRILILFAIVLVSIQAMIDPTSFETKAEEQNISMQAGRPALRQLGNMPSGTNTARRRLPHKFWGLGFGPEIKFPHVTNFLF